MKNMFAFGFVFVKTFWKNISLLIALQVYADNMSAITTDENTNDHMKKCSLKIRHSEPFCEQRKLKTWNQTSPYESWQEYKLSDSY